MGVRCSRYFGTLVLLACGISATARAADDPAAALEKLKAGNGRFVADQLEPRNVDGHRRQQLTAGQHPFAILLSCADSRVPPEYVFDVGLGDLFVIRVAGEVTDRAVLASVEYAAEHLDVPLLVVMGHEACGAVKAAAESTGASMGANLDYLVHAIQPAVDRTRGEQNSVKAAILANVELVIADVLEQSEIVSHLVAEKRLRVVAGYYELATGQVTFTDPGVSPTHTPTHGDAPKP